MVLRAYRPSDYQQVVNIFTYGTFELSPIIRKGLYNGNPFLMTMELVSLVGGFVVGGHWMCGFAGLVFYWFLVVLTQWMMNVDYVRVSLS